MPDEQTPQSAPGQPAPPQPGQQPAPPVPFAQGAQENSQNYAPPVNPGTNYQYVPEPVWQGIGSAKKEKWVAAVLAFTLGCFGIHKFYLGYKSEGIAMILITVIGSLCLGLGAFVMYIFALIEAVRYVTLTQEDFEQAYVINRKGWL
jgi:TM2 domain-containing membrane protein YozV